MKKKYTIEEFKEMFVEAQARTLAKMLKDMKEADTKGEMGEMGYISFNLHNMMCMSQLYKELFKVE